MSDTDSGDSDDRGLDPRVAKRRQDALGRGLQTLYDNVVAEPVPDDFMKILEQIDATPSAKTGPKAKTEKQADSAGGEGG